MNTISLRPQISNKSKLEKRKKIIFAITEKLKYENRTYIEWLNYKPDYPRSHDFLKYFVITKLRFINNKNPFDAYSMIDRTKDTYFTDFYVKIYKNIARNYYDILNKFDKDNMKTIYKTVEVKIPKRNKDRSLKYKRINYKNQIINTICNEISDDLSKLKNISIPDILEKEKSKSNILETNSSKELDGKINYESDNVSSDNVSSDNVPSDVLSDRYLSTPDIPLSERYQDFIEVYNNISPDYIDYSNQNNLHNTYNYHINNTNYEDDDDDDEDSNYIQ